MRRLKRTAAMAGTTAVLILWAGVSVFRADLSIIEKITTTFETVYGELKEIPDPEITVNGTGCPLRGVQFQTGYDNWKPRKKVGTEITVNVDSGKIFPTSLNHSQCKVTGTDFVSAKVLDDTTLQIRVDHKPATVLGATEKTGWSSSSKKKAVWKSVGYAPGYTLTLRGGNKVVKRLTVEGSSVDLFDCMKDMDRTYYYEVEAVLITSEQKKYLEEGAYVASTDQEFDWEGYKKEEKRSPGLGGGGSIKGDSYTMPDGGRVSNTWKMVSGRWYYFDGNSNRAKGRLDCREKWYYMDRNRAMCTGWVNTSSDSWSHLGPGGDVHIGWIQPVPGLWYCLNNSGYMERDWVYIGGKWYHMDQDGRMQID